VPEPARTDAATSPTGRDGHGRSAALGVIVLAAGEGTRMKSARPKVLHAFAGRTMLGHVLASTAPLDATTTVVVVGHARDQVTAHLAQLDPSAIAAVQHEQRGTGHAVQVALQAAAAAGGGGFDTVLVLPGDAPLLRDQTLAALLASHRATGAAATMLTSDLVDPTGYGRVLRAPDGTVTAVVEHRDATAEQLLVTEVSALVYAFDAARLRSALERIGSDNSQGELYLPDVVGILRGDGDVVHAVLAPAQETAGVNDRVQLAQAHRTLTDRLLDGHMRAGVTVVDPRSTWVDVDVRIERDVTLLPGVQLQTGTTVATGAVIGPDCTITATSVGAGATVNRAVTDGVTIGARATVGPFAYLRGGAELAEAAKVGTFVEVKNSVIGEKSKVPHLSYVGDATIGVRSNIGAATIFANYDGVRKNRSVVGDDVRIGSDTTVVAPVRIGDGAYTGAGTVVRADVPADALAVSMGKQRNIPGRGASARPKPAASSAHPAPEAPSSPPPASTEGPL
jgi:bifunctional UDP-N-acetylglucosamine pyrophosphorylase / glucosamine-1-phosphate N-acetyltransferase